MRVRIEKGRAEGEITAPASKSVCHRLIIGAALSDGESVLSGISLCEDCLATIECLKTLGVDMILEGDRLTVRANGFKNIKPKGSLNCRESGSTLRFLIPLALLTGEEVMFVGAERLLERPLSVYEDICKKEGFLFERSDEGIKVKGRLKSGDYFVQGNISSQFITGLMFALSMLEGDSRIIITTETESGSYIALTSDAMKKFGKEAYLTEDNTVLIKGGAGYTAKDLTVEGDYSGAAFMIALTALGGKVRVHGLDNFSKQGDRAAVHLYPRLMLGNPTISIKDCPDLGPILFAVAAAKHGATFTDTARLKIKESDRAAAMASELEKFGVRVSVSDNSVLIDNQGLHAPGEVLCSHNDHRIVMALSVLLTLFGGEIEGAEAITKSYGGFFDDLEKLGITVKRYEI